MIYLPCELLNLSFKGNALLMATSKTRVLAIGLDSADSSLVWDMQASGELPHIQSLVQRGMWGALESPRGMGDDGMWASFSCARWPGRHGRFFWRTILAGSYETPIAAGTGLDAETFWSQLSSAGCKVGVIDVPKSPLNSVENGFQLSDWLVHGRDGATRSWPPELAKQILATYGDDRVDRYGTEDHFCREEALPAELHCEFLQRLFMSLDSKCKASAGLLEEGEWDLFLTVFKEAHCAGHEFWHLVDSEHPRNAEPTDEAIKNSLQAVYHALDASVGKLLSLVDENTYVLLFSGLGMGPNYTGEHLLARVLERLESKIPDHLKIQSAYDGVPCNKVLPKKSTLTHPKTVMRQIEHNEISGAVRFNIVGREPGGVLRPGKELTEWYDWIEAALLGLVNPDTGASIVEEVIRSDLHYPGESRGRLPDLFIVWKRESPITAVASTLIGEIREEPGALRSGNHLADGFYLLCGPDFPRASQGKLASIVDIGPTIADLLGNALQDCDGVPIQRAGCEPTDLAKTIST